MAAKHKEITEAYKNLMVEVRARNDALNLILENKNGLGPIVVRECAYLQLRFMCELVAMACVVAHDHLTQADLRKLRKTWHAADILDTLERHHIKFFPRAATRQQTMIAGQSGHHINFVEGQLDKAGLKKLWERCGGYLRRGTVNELGKSQTIEKSFTDVRDHQSALIGLLNQHVISSRDENDWLIRDMRSGPLGQALTVAWATIANINPDEI
jgi:hypothetical protein